MSARLGTFGLEDGVDELRLEREEPLKAGGARVLVRQLWHGVPVAGADARAIVTADGQLTSLIAGFERDLDAPLVPRIAPANAIERAAAAAGLGSAAAPGAATLVVERRADGDHLEWEVSQHRSDGEPLKTRIDAVSGEVLDADAGISHAVGRVYPTDPRQPLEERELLRLLPGPPLRANGYGIDDALAPPVVPVPPDDYRLNPGDAGFDQVNLYWHVDHFFHDFLAPLGYPGPPDSLVVRLHFALDPRLRARPPTSSPSAARSPASPARHRSATTSSTTSWATPCSTASVWSPVGPAARRARSTRGSPTTSPPRSPGIP
jgi:hypothetical protein